jgi:hypothetical protein
MSGAVERAVRRDLRRVDKEIRGSALAAGAIRVAQLLDAEPEDTSEKRMQAAAQALRQLQAAMGELMRHASRETTDGIDDLRARRAARRAAAG